MYVVVAGGGHMGTHLVSRLVAGGARDGRDRRRPGRSTRAALRRAGSGGLHGQRHRRQRPRPGGASSGADVAVAMTGPRRRQPLLLPARPLLRRAARARAHAEPAVRGALPAGGGDQDPQRGRHPRELVPHLHRVPGDRRAHAGGQGRHRGLRGGDSRRVAGGGPDRRRDRGAARRTSPAAACSSAWSRPDGEVEVPEGDTRDPRRHAASSWPPTVPTCPSCCVPHRRRHGARAGPQSRRRCRPCAKSASSPASPARTWWASPSARGSRRTGAGDEIYRAGRAGERLYMLRRARWSWSGVGSAMVMRPPAFFGEGAVTGGHARTPPA